MSESDPIPNGFRQILGFPRYAIDEHGNVISIANGQGKHMPWKNAKRINPVPTHDGYYRVYLRHNERKQYVFVHRLVLSTFVGPCPDGMVCRHLDGCQTNNHVSNLKWGSSQENEQDKILHGTVSRGESMHNAKLTEKDVLEIRRRAANGERNVDIAKEFSVTQAAISLIVRRKAWKHIIPDEQITRMNKVYNISQFAERINVSASTLRRWDESGEFTAKRRESGHRFYDEEDVRVALEVTSAHVHEQQAQDARTDQYFTARHDARVAAGNQSLFTN